MNRMWCLVCVPLLLACAAKPAPADGPPPATAEPVEADPAVQTAEAHYRALEQGDRAAFEDTCTPNSRPGSVPMWWTTGRRYVESYGVRWVYDRTEPQGSGRSKVFFRRIQRDGSQRGMPVPCTVVLQDGRWLVDTSTQ